MARFNTNTARSSDASTQQDDWKAKGFINLYLPKKNPDGTIGKFKLGAIPVTEKGAMVKLLERLQADPDGTLNAIKGALELDYQSADGGSKVEFAF